MELPPGDLFRGGQRPAASGFENDRSAYGPAFWLAYLANALTMIAISLLVRYADFISFLGGGEGQLGLVVGIGMVGSLAMRMAQGSGIDRYGPRAIWLGSLVMLVLSLLAHLAVSSAGGLAIYAVRIAMQTAIAGIFGASITYISRRVPPERMAEIIGTLGTSGFIGILIGPQLADWIIGEGPVHWEELRMLFLTAAGLVSMGLFAAALATRGDVRPQPRRRPPLTALLGRYHPGPVLLVAAAVGAGLAVPNTFLRPFAAERSIGHIGVFFASYALSAFAIRMSTRRCFERYGNRPWVLTGLAAMSLSILLYLVVWQTWHLLLPGVVAGVAHALLFPSVVAGGSTAFPERYRGLGTTLMLAMFDVGNLFGAPLVGGVLLAARRLDLPAYPTLFVLVSALLALVAVHFAWQTSRAVEPRRAWAAARRRRLRMASGVLRSSPDSIRSSVVSLPASSPAAESPAAGVRT